MTKVGSAVTTQSGQSNLQAIDAFETLTGRLLPVRRCYEGEGVIVTSVTASAAKHDLNKRKSIYSIKPSMTSSLADMAALAASIVTAEHPLDLIIWHEPVDNMAGLDFQAVYRRSCEPFREAGIPVGVCFTNWSCNLPYSNVQSALNAYWPGDDVVDFIAIDEYPMNEITSTKDAMPMEQRTRRVSQFADVRGKPLTLAEFGVDLAWDATKADRWLRSVTDWGRQRAQLGKPLRDVCYFHSNVGGNFWLGNRTEYVDSYTDMAALLEA